MQLDTCLVNWRDPKFKFQHHKKEEKTKDRKGGEERGEKRKGRKGGKQEGKREKKGKKEKRKWLEEYCSSDGGRGG